MKKLSILAAKVSAVIATTSFMAVNAFATTAETTAVKNRFEDVYKPIVDLLNSIMVPLLAIVGGVGAIYCVLLGIKFAKAEEPQDREKAKSALKNAIIGFGLIFVLILALNLLMPVMERWVADQGVNM